MTQSAARGWFVATFLLALSALASSAPRADAAPKKVLFVTFDGGYNSDGFNAKSELETYVTSLYGQGQVDYLVLSSNGQVAAALAANTYEQIWTYDLSTGADDYPLDYAAIASWYSAAPLKEVICDGRFLSSFWAGRYSTEGRLLVQNYFYNLDARGGGIVLGTDHNEYANLGMNILADTLGIGPFTGNFGGNFPLDAGHPLTTDPNTLTSLSNDSTTGQAPFGLQPGGRTLRTLGYHSGNTLTPGISTTIDGGVLGITVAITGATTALCDGTRTFTASITSGAEFGPFTYQWRVNDVLAGSGPTFAFDASSAAPGTYAIKVIAQGAGQRADDDLVTITVGGAACGCGFDAEVLCDDGGAIFAIGLEGPQSGRYALCRVVPAGYGNPAASATEFRCEDADNNGVVDLVTADQLAAQFGAGFCGMP
ncbi:MAG: hypothetical protein JNJ59_11760 [Deltaproteobacteria bacterium]|nr:hypothetical protein [Deltaproteobacteria bacterium]